MDQLGSRIGSRRQWLAYAAVFVAASALTAGVAGLLADIGRHKGEEASYPLRVVEIPEGEIDPTVWGRNFPLEYERFVRTEENSGRTDYGGSEPYSKLERYPAMTRLWAGYAFAIDHDEERGHHYALIDQKNTDRLQKPQPGACANCHAGEAPALIAEMGWEAFNRTPYDELKDRLHTGSTCADCHDPETMELVVTRPGLQNALAERGVDLEKATHQEMRTYVCAQCHVEYYFKGDDKILTYPWSQGLSIDEIEAHYDTYGFSDWTHAESGATMIKIQHPEFEMYSSGLHARSGVACADCHMPYMRSGAVKVADHWVRSPLHNLEASCQTCHNIPVEDLRERVKVIQDNTAGLLRQCEEALLSAIDTIAAAQDQGVADADLAEARQLHRSAQLRWDFVSSENSTGFHSPQESARILAGCIDRARQAELLAWQSAGGRLVLPTAAPTPEPAVEGTTALTPARP